ncbi:hypothetical protein PV05_11465 [Exophiala xenobiotica]|uniref:Thiamine-binding protein domain-containing protein n=1 Tax=Exophiala xenobiotica TaxID=348802 RepID=A0A0D2EPT9_9EURO|nr:uncharacterized protein PV05_11465 [Exophiala xenobiotica]KIW49819.1 hypothetical protein PV05_11465 [Exophiala xenobiotica]
MSLETPITTGDHWCLKGLSVVITTLPRFRKDSPSLARPTAETPFHSAWIIMATDLKDLATPAKCTADFCLIPLGTPTASVSAQIADVQRLMKKSGLKYSMHSAGTTVEGSWDDVTRLIGQAHTILHEKGIVRIQTDIRIGSRTDKAQTMEDKVAAVEKLLSTDT